jgi:PPK2 family polyphosphate:nucleotide phosphotransferase
MDLRNRYIVEPGKKLKLAKWSAEDTGDLTDKAEGQAAVEILRAKLDKLQDVFYAAHKHALLIVLQGIDASGKDGTIKHVMSGVNPQGCHVTSFKQPSSGELDHDYLWRIHQEVPGRGIIGIFNRSHYEEVLVVRVHNIVPREIWSKRYDQINAFEKILAENGVVILKFFLHISKDEQKRRFEARLHNPKKNWKSSEADEAERAFWDDYQEAFEDALEKCSTKHAPWYVIPANKKWFRNVAISQIIVDTLEDLHLKYPTAPSPAPKVAGNKKP